MIDLATQLIDRQAAEYDPTDFEDRYETRLRAMIDAKIAGSALLAEPEEAPSRGNVIDLVAALKRSFADATLLNGGPLPDPSLPIKGGSPVDALERSS